jgi:hypothetical protein
MTDLIVSLGRIFASRRGPHAYGLYVVGALTVLMMCVAADPVWAFPESFGPQSFGVYRFENMLENQDSSPAIQAGAHPYSMSTSVVFNHAVTEETERHLENLACLLEEPGCAFVPDGEPEITADLFGSPRQVEVNLPQGMVVNPNATLAKCTEAQLETTPGRGGGCPAASAVGISIPSVSPFGEELRSAIYNMVPPPGIPAEFGVDPGVGLIFHIVGKLRTGGDYGLSGEASDITQKVSVYGFKLVFWGDPTAEVHDPYRDVCAKSGKVKKEIEKEFFDFGFTEESRFNCPLASDERTGEPLLTMPGSCTGNELKATMNATSWQKPLDVIGPPAANTTAGSPAVQGCGQLHFNPSLDVTPDPAGAGAESPSGLDVDLRMPQEQNVNVLGEADLKKAVVTLPEGMAVSPSSADGLGVCTPAEIGLHDANKPSCPNSSKLGDAEVTTPLLESPLKGDVYLAQQETFEKALIGLYLVVEGQGALVKLGGTVALDPNTGRITATFDDNPQLPFNDVKLKFFSGPRAPLVTPAGCGSYVASSQLTPWSGGTPAQPPSGSFEIESGCTHPFAPAFAAGTTGVKAGAYTSFSLTLSRQDGEQRLGSIRVTTPPGLLANLQSVPQCAEPQASRGECPEASRIGESTASAGPGPDPFWVKGGRVYLTGPYGGAPFGLSIVVPAVAGPFNLGNVVARASIGVDSHTAQAIVTGEIPTIKDGIPLDVRTVNVTIERPGFMFNPTNCTPSAVTGILTSTTGMLAGVSSPFGVAGCATLPFKPSFNASTVARTSKANGASLTVKVGSSTGQANIAKVRVTLPKQLPARLTTLQKACTETVFNANPAACPVASVVGTATAVTPVLAHPLTGPAYLVSHGGAAFPDLVFVLQGEGIKLYLDGNTNIKRGITTSTFNSVPDAPISSFVTVFPQGPHSVLATNIPAKTRGSMCKQKLTMPTTITGQNGAVKTQTTKITITGCPKKHTIKTKTRKPGGTKR